MSDDIIEYRRTERRHMIAIKEALAAGISRSPVNPDHLLACVDYLKYIIGRFNAQGRANIERLLPRIEAAANDEDQRMVADIAATLDQTETELGWLVSAAAVFRSDPDKGPDNLLQACRGFVAFYDGVLAVRKNPAQSIIDRYFSAAEYWALTDDVTPASIEIENRLFRRVTQPAP